MRKAIEHNLRLLLLITLFKVKIKEERVLLNDRKRIMYIITHRRTMAVILFIISFVFIVLQYDLQMAINNFKYIFTSNDVERSMIIKSDSYRMIKFRIYKKALDKQIRN